MIMILASAAETTMSERLSTAGIHTLIGMGTVFAVLVLMVGVISLFRFIPDKDKDRKKAARAVTESTKSAEAAKINEAQAPAAIEAEPEDDLALIAVITAAIAAARGTQEPGGFIVRSIRRSSNNQWK